MSGLEDLYREIILDHYRSPRNRGELESPPARVERGFNPLCGDEIVVYADIDDDGVITDIRIGGQGCSISQASASMMSAAVKGKTVAEARALTGAFKAMMSVHGSELSDSDADDLDAVGSAADGDIELGDLEALRGVVKFPVRIKCANLSWNTLDLVLDDSGDSPA